MNSWTPIARTFEPSPFAGTYSIATIRGATGLDMAAGLMSYHSQAGLWDQPSAVYGLLDDAGSPQLEAAVAAASPTGLGMIAVCLPESDYVGGYTPYHQLVCLELSAWDGIACVYEGIAHLSDGTQHEYRVVHIVSAQGTHTSVANWRNPHPSVPEASATVPDGWLVAFMRAARGLPNASFLPFDQIGDWLQAATAAEPRPELSALTDDHLSDEEAIRACVRLLAHPPQRHAALGLPAPTQADNLGSLIAKLNTPELDIAVTPELRRWLGDDILYGLHTTRAHGRSIADYYTTCISLSQAIADPDNADAIRVRSRLLDWANTLPEPVDALSTDLCQVGHSTFTSYLVLTGLDPQGCGVSSLRELLHTMSPDWRASKRSALKTVAAIERLHRRYDTRNGGIAAAYVPFRRVHAILTGLADPQALAAHLA